MAVQYTAAKLFPLRSLRNCSETQHFSNFRNKLAYRFRSGPLLLDWQIQQICPNARLGLPNPSHDFDASVHNGGEPCQPCRPMRESRSTLSKPQFRRDKIRGELVLIDSGVVDASPFPIQAEAARPIGIRITGAHVQERQGCPLNSEIKVGVP